MPLKTPVSFRWTVPLRGKTLSSDSMEFAASDSELYLDITAVFILKVREESRPLFCLHS
jgi:hypothetical protein